MSETQNGSPPQPSLGPILPPWLWLWLGLYIASLPAGQLPLLITNLQPLVRWLSLALGPSGEAMGGTPGALSLSLTLVPVAFEVGLHLVVLIGVVLVFLPWLRAAYVEASAGLGQPDYPVAALDEIGAFVGRHVAGIQIRANLARVNSSKIFVYPCGIRRFRLGIHGGFVKLWRRDRDLAQGILLHEIAHFRQGDALILGAGSFFEHFARHWWRLYVLLVLLPFLAIVAIQMLTVWSDVSRTNAIVREAGLALPFPALAAQFLRHEAVQFLTLTVPGIFTVLSVTLLTTLTTLLLPWAGIWYAELTADRTAAAATRGNPGRLLAALGQLDAATQRGWAARWRSFLALTTHPPATLRRHIARHPDGRGTHLVLFAIFPMAILLRLLMLMAMAGLSGYDGPTTRQLAIGYLSGPAVQIWLLMAGVLLLWPILSPYWLWLFTRRRGARMWTGYGANVLAASVMLALALGGRVIGTIPGMLGPVTAQSAPEPSELAVGEVETISGLEFAVLGWERMEGDDSIVPSPDMEFVAVEIVIANVGSEAQRVSTVLNMQLYDDQGREYALRPELALLMDSALPETRIAVGERLRGKVGYEVSRDATGLVFAFGFIGVDSRYAVVALGNGPRAVTVPSQLSAQAVAPSGLSENVSLDGVQLVVHGITTPAAIGMAAPRPGFRYVAVDFELSQRDGRRDRVNPLDFELKDALGRLYTVDTGATFAAGATELAPFELAGGEPVTGRLGFEIPEDATDLLFTLIDPDSDAKVFVRIQP